MAAIGASPVKAAQWLQETEGKARTGELTGWGLAFALASDAEELGFQLACQADGRVPRNMFTEPTWTLFGRKLDSWAPGAVRS